MTNHTTDEIVDQYIALGANATQSKYMADALSYAVKEADLDILYGMGDGQPDFSEDQLRHAIEKMADMLNRVRARDFKIHSIIFITVIIAGCIPINLLTGNPVWGIIYGAMMGWFYRPSSRAFTKLKPK